MYLARMFVAANLEHLQLVPQTWTRILLVTEVYIYYTVYCSIRGIPLIIYFVLYCIVYFRSIVTTVKPLPQATLSTSGNMVKSRKIAGPVSRRSRLRI